MIDAVLRDRDGLLLSVSGKKMCTELGLSAKVKLGRKKCVEDVGEDN